MVWLIALVCMGLVGVAGYYQGPVRGAFSFFGLVFGAVLAGPLSPLTKHLLPVIGLVHPVWGIFVPQAIAFLLVLIIFKIAGQVFHQKIAVYFKYKADDVTRLSWQQMYSRVGFCVGMLNGSIYFLLLMVPIYVGGYFTAEAQTSEGDPASARFLTQTRAELQKVKLDHVVAAYDPTPPQVYKAADIATLVLHNPLLEARLSHYPPLLQLAEQPEFKSLANDVPLQQLIQTQAKAGKIIEYPKVQAIVTNAAITAEVSALIGNDLDDLQGFLMTGQSAKYDSEPILGIWTGDRAGTMTQARRRQPGMTPLQLREKEQNIYPILEGLSLTAIPNGQMILKKSTPNNPDNTVVATGTWKREGAGYQVTLPGSHPETSDVRIEDGNELLLPKDGYVLVFDKEM
jgi:hypothetical protein